MEPTLVLYTTIGVCILISLIALVVLYDLCSRFREQRTQQISDGGPPASPGHHYSYTVGIRADEATPSFDAKQSVIRVELLDSQNQYLTSLAIPCFVFKFKSKNVGPAKSPPPGAKSPAAPAHQSKNSGANATAPILVYKSLTTLHEGWSNTPKSNLITFHIVRRNPLHNLAAIRLAHDCYLPNAELTLSHIIIRDDATRRSSKFDLQNRPIRAIHPCPPSGLQVFRAERIVGAYQLEETKPLIQVMTRYEIIILTVVFVEVITFVCCMALAWFGVIEEMQDALSKGTVVGVVSIIIMGCVFVSYIFARRGTTRPFRANQVSFYLLLTTVLAVSAATIYGAYRLAVFRATSFQAFSIFLLYFFITYFIAITTMLLVLILVTIALSFVKFVEPDTEASEPTEGWGAVLASAAIKSKDVSVFAPLPKITAYRSNIKIKSPRNR